MSEATPHISSEHVRNTDTAPVTAAGKSGVTAGVIIVEFLRDWTNLTTSHTYQVGDFEKFSESDPAHTALVRDLHTAGVVRRVST